MDGKKIIIFLKWKWIKIYFKIDFENLKIVFYELNEVVEVCNGSGSASATPLHSTVNIFLNIFSFGGGGGEGGAVILFCSEKNIPPGKFQKRRHQGLSSDLPPPLRSNFPKNKGVILKEGGGVNLTITPNSLLCERKTDRATERPQDTVSQVGRMLIKFAEGEHIHTPHWLQFLIEMGHITKVCIWTNKEQKIEWHHHNRNRLSRMHVIFPLILYYYKVKKRIPKNKSSFVGQTLGSAIFMKTSCPWGDLAVDPMIHKKNHVWSLDSQRPWHWV